MLFYDIFADDACHQLCDVGILESEGVELSDFVLESHINNIDFGCGLLMGLLALGGLDVPSLPEHLLPMVLPDVLGEPLRLGCHLFLHWLPCYLNILNHITSYKYTSLS